MRRKKSTDGMPAFRVIQQRAIIDFRNYYRVASDEDRQWLRDRVLQLERDCPYSGELKHCKYKPLSEMKPC